jgi:hypothetical protein
VKGRTEQTNKLVNKAFELFQLLGGGLAVVTAGLLLRFDGRREFLIFLIPLVANVLLVFLLKLLPVGLELLLFALLKNACVEKRQAKINKK